MRTSIQALMVMLLLFPRLAAAEEPEAVPVVASRLVERAVGKVNAERVNIRSGPSTSYNIIITVDRETELQVRSYREGWYEVELPQGAGCWVYMEYIKVDMPEGGMDPGQPLPGVITGNKVRLRAAPDMMLSNVLVEMNKGDRVMVIGKVADWYKVRSPEGTRGWISAKYVDLPEGMRVTGQPLPGSRTRAMFPDVREEMPLPMFSRGEVESSPGSVALPAMGSLARAEHHMAEELKKPPLERNFSEAIALYNRVLASNASTEEKKASRARLRQIFTLTPRRELAKYMLDVSRKVEDEIKRTEKRYEAQIEMLRARLPRSRYTARGTLYLAQGKAGGVRYRIKMGNITVYLLKISQRRYDHLLGKEVGVIGEVLPPPPGFDIEVINVANIEPTR